MTLDIQRLRDLLAEATPGPWEASFDGYMIGNSVSVKMTGANGEHITNRLVLSEQSRGDTALVAAAVNALPQLLAIADAAIALRYATWADMDGTHVREALLREFVAAVDAARKAGT